MAPLLQDPATNDRVDLNAIAHGQDIASLGNFKAQGFPGCTVEIADNAICMLQPDHMQLVFGKEH